MRPILLSGLFLVAASLLPAAAQEMGGVGLLPEALAAGGPRGLARPLLSAFPSIGAADLQAQAVPDAAQRRQQHQDLIARVRGDGGFLDGFSQGQPLATTRQRPLPGPVPVLADPPIVEQIFAPTINRTTVRNRFEAPVAITTGDNNLVLQQGSQSGGTNAQQQVVNIGGNARPGGASNVVTPSGTVLQQAGGDSAPRRRHLSRR